MCSLLTTTWDVFYRPREMPRNGACPHCTVTCHWKGEDNSNSRFKTNMHLASRDAVDASMFIAVEKEQWPRDSPLFHPADVLLFSLELVGE